jgi:predicted Rossmann-fold nucleotide-binding protein
VQTAKMEKVPVILVGETFWRNFDNFIRETILAAGKIDPDDTGLYLITDDEDEIIRAIARAKVRHVVQPTVAPRDGATPRG